MKCTVALVVLALALSAAQASVLPLWGGLHGLDGTHHGVVATHHGLIGHGHGLVVGHDSWDGTHQGVVATHHGLIGHGHGLIGHGHGLIGHGHGLVGSSAVHVSTVPLVHAAAVASVPLVHAHVAHEGSYVAANRGSVHVAPLAGHLQSASSINLQPAPGTW